MAIDCIRWLASLAISHISHELWCDNSVKIRSHAIQLHEVTRNFYEVGHLVNEVSHLGHEVGHFFHEVGH